MPRAAPVCISAGDCKCSGQRVCIFPGQRGGASGSHRAPPPMIPCCHFTPDRMHRQASLKRRKDRVKQKGLLRCFTEKEGFAFRFVGTLRVSPAESPNPCCPGDLTTDKHLLTILLERCLPVREVLLCNASRLRMHSTSSGGEEKVERKGTSPRSTCSTPVPNQRGW